jgi:hypothetical protein
MRDTGAREYDDAHPLLVQSIRSCALLGHGAVTVHLYV